MGGRWWRLVRSKMATRNIGLIEIDGAVLADLLPHPVWVVDAVDKSLLYMNASFRRSFADADKIKNTWQAIVNPDDLPSVETLLSSQSQDDQPPQREIRMLCSDGRQRWHRLSTTLVKRRGVVIEIVATALDIDELVRAREALQEATDLFSLSQEAAGAGTWELDLRSGAVRLSRESARLHGMTVDRAVSIDLDTWRSIVDPDDGGRIIEILQTAVETKQTYSGEFRVRAPDGGVRWLNGLGQAYYDDDGQALRMIGLNFDVTERRTTEERLRAARRAAEEARGEAESASLSKSEFLAGMSHELRTPLNSIIGYTDLLLEEIDHGSPLRRRLEIVQESGIALLTIVNDILDFSKLEAGQVQLDPITFSPRALLESVSSILLGIAHRKKVTLTRQVSLNVPDFMIGDENRLRQILLNLGNNALKFTDAGFVAISMSCERTATPGDIEMVRFSVRDTGVGISALHQERLFQRFSQVDNSIARRFGGTGLGLAISKQIVEIMRGEIGVESVEGEGSTFWFRVPLPLAAVPVAVAPSAQEPVETRTALILLVEDVIVNQELARAVLERAGHQVDIASNGDEAIALVRDRPYDLVLMDVHMPVMDGVAATQAIRASTHAHRDVPIIAMTANVLPQQISTFKAAGMSDHVGKPFRRLELLSTVERWLSRAGTATSASEIPSPPTRLNPDAFAALQDMLGREASRTIAAKFAADLSSRLLHREVLAADAHAIINAAGIFGFRHLVEACRAAEAGGDDHQDQEAKLQALAAEKALALSDLQKILTAE